MNPEVAHIWQAVVGELRAQVDPSSYDIWLAPLQPVSFDGRRLVLSSPAEIRSWVDDRYGVRLRAAAAAAAGEDVEVEVTAAAERAAGTAGRGRDGRADPAPLTAPAAPDLNPKFTFGQFVIGDSNRFAHAAALAVAELPGQAYNPRFIYGPPGVGKTHLLHSIGNYARRYGGGLSVRYTTIEHFTNDFITSLKGGTPAVDRFKARYRRADVLLIDDVQFLESKAKTEEEFFHTFNALYDTGSQLVLTCDRLPRDMGALAERLRERFESGLLTDIQAPDAATRIAVLRKRVHHDGIEIPDEDVLHAIADRIPTNIRALEGALIRVVAFASLTGRPVSAALAGEVLDGLYGRAAPGQRAPAVARISVSRIQDLICEAFSITRDELLSPSRAARVAWPRQVAMYLAREHTDATLPAIGASFGGRNHTTVMHAVRRTSERLATDPDAYETVRSLTARLQQREADRRD